MESKFSTLGYTTNNSTKFSSSQLTVSATLYFEIKQCNVFLRFVLVICHSSSVKHAP